MVTHSWDPWARSAYVAYVACHANVFLPTNGLFKFPNDEAVAAVAGDKAIPLTHCDRDKAELITVPPHHLPQTVWQIPVLWTPLRFQVGPEANVFKRAVNT